MKVLIVLGLVMGLAMASIDDHREELLQENRVPKVAVFGSVCDECENIIQRLVQVAKDPTKLAELKLLLSALCHETSYEEECRVFVSKIDLFIAKLLPHLKDYHKVCQEMHMCSNRQIEMFHRVGLIYAKKYLNKVDGASDLICEECTFAAHELQQVVDNHETQIEVKKFLSEKVCGHLGQFQGSCDIVVEDFLPEIFQELHTLLQEPREFCEHLKLCKPTSASLMNKNKDDEEEVSLELGHDTAPQPFFRLLERLDSVPMDKNNNELPSMGCAACRIAVETLILHLEEDGITQSIGYDLRDFVCPNLPTNMFEGCKDFLTMYAPPVVKMAVSQLTPGLICNAIHACTAQTFRKDVEFDKLKTLSCESCNGVTELLQTELASRELRRDLVHEVKHVICSKAPLVLQTPCQNLMKRYAPLAMSRFTLSLQNGQLCKTVHAC